MSGKLVTAQCDKMRKTRMHWLSAWMIRAPRWNRSLWRTRDAQWIRLRGRPLATQGALVILDYFDYIIKRHFRF